MSPSSHQQNPGPVILRLDEIRQLVDVTALIDDISAAFVDYSAGRSVVPPVGHLAFEEPWPGDVHIKYGYLRDGRYYVVKIASGFPRNELEGIPVSNGVMLLFERKTGALAAILLDEGYLTDLRTAVAGAIAARLLAPSVVQRIGIVGTGMQARYQLRLLAHATACREVIVWGRTAARLEKYQEDMERDGFRLRTTLDIRELVDSSNLIVTTTLARAPLIPGDLVRPGTHITAMGADAPGKQELDARLVARADVVVADSRSQCIDHGEISHAVHDGLLATGHVVELGEVIAGKRAGRTSDMEITVCDLTGLAVQDMAVAAHVFGRAKSPVSSLRSPVSSLSR